MSVLFPMSDRDATLIASAIRTFRSLITKQLTVKEGSLIKSGNALMAQKVIEKPTEFTLGQLARVIQHKKDPVNRDLYEAMRKHKDEIVVLA
jgi:hypothetical protein